MSLHSSPVILFPKFNTFSTFLVPSTCLKWIIFNRFYYFILSKSLEIELKKFHKKQLDRKQSSLRKWAAFSLALFLWYSVSGSDSCRGMLYNSTPFFPAAPSFLCLHSRFTGSLLREGRCLSIGSLPPQPVDHSDSFEYSSMIRRGVNLDCMRVTRKEKEKH